MSLSGNLQTMPFADVLQFVGLGRKTGVLSVEQGVVRKQVVIEGGLIAYCSSGNPKEYLGQHLLARTRISERQLADAFRLQAESGQLLGEILVATGAVTPGTLDTVLRRKIEDAIYEVFTWTAGRFDFRDGATLEGGCPVRLGLDWQDAIMEGARRSDEMRVVRQVIPDGSVRFRVYRDRFPAGFPTTSGDVKLIEMLALGLSAEDVCPRFHASDFDILKRLCALTNQGLLEVEAGGQDGSSADAGAREAIRSAVALMDSGHLLAAHDALLEASRKYPSDPEFPEGLQALEKLVRREIDAAGVPDLPVRIERLAQASLSSKQGYVVSRINGRWSVRAIAQVCPFSELEVLVLLHDLVQRDLVVLHSPTGARS